MSHCYFESRPRPLSQTTELTAEMMRHLHARQYLGKTLVICAKPLSTMRVARKQWLRLARITQKKRASTVNADKILRFTYAITHMQHMQFTTKTPLQHPDADVYFAAPEHLSHTPLGCFNVYAGTELHSELLRRLLAELPESALLIDYTGKIPVKKLGLRPKSGLDKQAKEEWQHVVTFFKHQQIDIARLTRVQFTQIGAMDDALDTLLGISHEFLHIASAFQHALELARPLKTNKVLKEEYNTMALLAYRVQALTPGLTSANYRLRSYFEDETYFLHDITTDLTEGKNIAETAARRQEAGRQRLAVALLDSLQRLRVSSNNPQFHPSFARVRDVHSHFE